MQGACTSYDLKRFVQLTIGHFWPFPHTQLYAEPARLAEADLLEESREDSGRRRRHYTITDAGRRQLEAWLAEPVTSPTEYRDLGLLKLFFGELGETEETLELAHEQAAAQRRQLAEYERILNVYGGQAEFVPRLRAAELGVRLARTAAEFWEEIAERESLAERSAA